MSGKRTQKLLSEIEAAHEFRQSSRPWSFEACGAIWTDRCAICGLERTEWCRGQNSPDGERFTRNGEDICLTDALACR